MGYDGAEGRLIAFYGLLVREDLLIRPTQAFRSLRRQLKVLDILGARRRISGATDHAQTQSAASRFPEEIWGEIRSFLISQYLGLLENNARLGMGKSCRAGKKVELKPSGEWTCFYQERNSPSNELCRKCQHYSDHGFALNYDARKVQQQMLASYGLYLFSEYQPLEEERVINYVGVAVHPPLKEFNNAQNCCHAYREEFIPLAALPDIDENDARIRMAAFVKDCEIDVNTEDPRFSFSWKENDWREDKKVSAKDQESKEKELEQRRQRFPPGIPRWMIFHSTSG